MVQLASIRLIVLFVCNKSVVIQVDRPGRAGYEQVTIKRELKSGNKRMREYLFVCVYVCKSFANTNEYL